MSLTGAPKPTFLYPRFRYGSPVVTLDIPEPASVLPTPIPSVGLAYENRVSNGKTEVLFSRIEESCGLAVRCEPEMVQALRWMCEDSVFRGHQFQAWVDRYTGSSWLFENTLKDQNGLALTLNGGGSATYTATANGMGLTLGAAQYLTVPLAQASASTPTGYDDPLAPTEGVMVADGRPTFAASDSTLHNLLSSSQFTLYKDTANRLVFQVGTNPGDNTSGAVTWSANARVQIVAAWFTDGTRSLAYAVDGGSFTSLTTTSGSNSTMSALPTTLYIGSDTSGANRATGTYDAVMFYKRGFTSPQATALPAYRPWRRNYFPYAEILQRQFQPVRVSLGRQIYDWTLSFRNGQP